MNRKYSQKEFAEIEKAIIFAGDQTRKYCRNQKPVLLHSIRVGITLLDHYEPAEVVIAGILHDLVEDTKCTIEEIKKGFGDGVAELVLANTFDPKIKDYKKRWIEETQKIIAAGREAMIIKVADQIDNFPYYILISDLKRTEEVLWKHSHIIENFKSHLKSEKLFQEYRELVEKRL